MELIEAGATRHRPSLGCPSMTNAIGNRRGFSVQLSALPDNERLIFKLIFSVSQKTTSRDYRYEIAGDQDPTAADIMVVDNAATSSVTSVQGENTGPKIVYVVDKPVDTLHGDFIQRPLIATRVLSVLDRVASEIERLEREQDKVPAIAPEIEVGHTQQLTSQPNDADSQVNESAASIEFSISEEEACELAIVHDETLSNPANNEDPTVESSAETDVPSEIHSPKNAVVTAFPKAALPSTPVAQEAESKVEPESEIEITSTPRALVVDDSASVRKQLELELELFNVTVDYAENGESALKLSSEQNYDVAFLDVVLPDIDGFQICKHIKSADSDVKVIMLTGKATQADKIKGKLAGCDDYLVKPVGRNTFQNTVKSYLSERPPHENLGAQNI